MNKKNTSELEKILLNTHPSQMNRFLQEQEESMHTMDRPFGAYVRELLKKKNLLQQELFIRADIPERYGYKLISEEKRTKQRDIILRLCYAGNFTLEETQKALRIYRMPELYAKIPRDAALMICFNERPGDIIEVNQFLKEHKLDMLRTSGSQD